LDDFYKISYNARMTTTTRNLLLTLIGVVVFGAAVFVLFKAQTASAPEIEPVPTTNQATTTQGEGASAADVLSSIDLKSMIDRARALKNAGNYDGAIAVLNQATAVYPNDTVAYNNLADIYMNFKKDYVLAELNYKKIIVNNATDLNAYRNLLELYTVRSFKSGTTAAADIVTSAIKAVPTAYDLQLILARYYRDSGRLAEARAQYQAAITNAKSQKLLTIVGQIEAEFAALPQ
jgi:tetratricopeptide (TPR) repeat protein